MQTVSPMNRVPLYLAEVPAEGGNVVRADVNFSGGDTQEIDLNPSQFSGHWSAAQTVYIDNEANSSEIVLVCEQSQQRISCPANSQMYMPLILPNPPKVTVTCANSIKISFLFLNFFLPPAIWKP